MKKSVINWGVRWAVTAAALSAGTAFGLSPFKVDTLDHIVKTHQGKPFVLVVWSLDCEFCQASLKTLAKAKITQKDLQIVTVSTDPIDDPQAISLMNNRLSTLGLSSNAFAFDTAPPEQLRYALDTNWRGEKPRSYWYNGRGKPVAYSGVITQEVIEKRMPKR